MRIWDSIAGRIWLVLVGFSLVILLPLGLFFSSQFSAVYYQGETEELSVKAALIAREKDTATAQQLAQSIAQQLGVAVFLGDTEGTMTEVWGRPGFGAGGGAGKGMGKGMGLGMGKGMGQHGGNSLVMKEVMQSLTLDLEDKAQLKAGKTIVHGAQTPLFDAPTLWVGVPIVQEGKGIEQVIFLFAPSQPIEDQMASIRNWVFGASGFALLLATLGAWALSVYVSRPLKQLHQAAEKMRTGDFSQRVPVAGKDEVGQLGETLNTLAGELDQTLGELEEKNRQLAQGVQTMKDLAANVSHDLRTPLFLIQGYAEAIQDELPKTAEERRQMAGLILEETGRMDQLVQDLLQLSRLESGHYIFEWIELAPGEILKDLAERMGGMAQEKDVALTVEVGGDLPLIQADWVRLEQALTNLLNNALRHTPSGGAITLRAEAQGTGVAFSIQDTGTGIPAEDLPHIWDRFYRGEKSRNRKTSGTGLGLAIVKAIVEGHGGRVEATSSEAGSEFRLWLPMDR